MGTDYSSATNAKRAAVGAKIPSASIVITKLPNGRFTFADAREAETETKAPKPARKAKAEKPAKVAKPAKAKAAPKP